MPTGSFDFRPTGRKRFYAGCDAHGAPMTFDELIHYLRIGGVTMAVILCASVVALGVAIERLIALWGVSDSTRMLGDSVARHLLAGNVAAARSAAERSG